MLAARDAAACSQQGCGGLRALPGEMTTVPANAPALRFFTLAPLAGDGGVGDAGASWNVSVTLGRRTAMSPAPVALGWPRAYGPGFEVTIDEALTPGETYELSAEAACDAGRLTHRSSFTAGPTAPMPTALGTLSASAVSMGFEPTPVSTGECAAMTPASTATVSIEHSADAAPWRSLLVYETLVDGVAWQPRTSQRSDGSTGTSPLAPGGSSFGRGQDHVYAICPPASAELRALGASEGRHRVKIRATLPGTLVALESNEVEIELRCAPVFADAGAPPPSHAGAVPDAAGDSGVAPMARGGCSVRGASHGGSSSLRWLVLGAGVALAWGARRSRERR